MQTTTTVFVIALAITLSGCSMVERLFEKDDDQKIRLEEIPVAVTAAAERAVPGLTIAAAEVDEGRDTPFYELEGQAEDRKYELRIDADGKVLRVKSAAVGDD